MTINATVHNSGSVDTGPLTASFYATPAGGTPWYIGSALAENVPAAGTATVPLQWNTTGFTGTVPVRVTVDPFNRVAEGSETNNQATASLAIRTRPDLAVTAMTLSDAEPVAGQAVTISLTVRNNGQAQAGASELALYAGPAGQNGTEVGAHPISALPGGGSETVELTWTPSGPGPYRLTARPDRGNAVAESDEAGNDRRQDLYVGLAGPVNLDSGAAGEAAYGPVTGYGYLDEGQPDVLGSCGTGAADTFRQDPDGAVTYRFDHLQPGHFYHLDLSLYECNQGASRQETVKVDGNTVAGPEDLGDGTVHRLSILLDPALYTDRSIRVTVEAYEGLGALVNEIALRDVDYRYADSGGPQDKALPLPLAGPRLRLAGWLADHHLGHAALQERPGGPGG